MIHDTVLFIKPFDSRGGYEYNALIMADPESYIKKTDTPELERNRGVEKSDQAAQNLGNTLEQKK